MKKMILPALLVCALALTSISADARRMGGGKSFGQQSSNVTQRQSASPAPAAPTQNAGSATAAKPGAAAAAPAKRPWGSMLGGLAAGLGLAWLAHSLGLGAAFGNILLIALLAFAALAAWRFFSAKSRAGGVARNGLAYGTAGGPASPVAPPEYSPKNVGNDASARPWERNAANFEAPSGAAAGGSLIGAALGGNQSWGVPAGFDTEGFLAAAKRNFVTLQDAWDRKDVGMLRSMMTDDMVGEINNQLAERESHTGGQVNKTDVVTLEAQLLGIEELPDAYLASVEFTGVIREDASAGPSPFREVWNMTKPTDGRGGWLVAGVQALQ